MKYYETLEVEGRDIYYQSKIWTHLEITEPCYQQTLVLFHLHIVFVNARLLV